MRMSRKIKINRFLKILIVFYCVVLKNVVDSESTINEKTISPTKNIDNSNNNNINNNVTVNQAASSNVSATPTSPSVVPLSATSTTTPVTIVSTSTQSSVASLAPEIKIANKTANYTESAENGPEISWMDVDITDEERNKTLIKNNITQINEESHEYYNSTIVQNENYTNLHRESIYAECKNLTVNKLLSKSHRRAMTVKLPFQFYFYGHPINNITIATGGFLYAGDYIHSWLAATQYISPLMANFDPSLSTDSYVKYCEDEKSFHVYWEQVYLQNKPKAGPFTFKASLYQDGDIIFDYYYIPIPITQIEDSTHPVKVGISDAYIVDKTVFQARRKTIFEYHRVNFPGNEIKNFTKIKLRPLPTCHTLTDCQSCLESEISFKCYWCPSLNRCSSGVDRNRQEWTNQGCDKQQLSEAKLCPKADIFPITPNINNNSNDISIKTKIFNNSDANQSISSPVTREQAKKSGTGFFTILTSMLALVFVAMCWVFYAYTHPHTSSGQLLIQYRPNNWSWRRGEARYTAATIHM